MKKRLLRGLAVLLLVVLFITAMPQTALASYIEKTYNVILSHGIDEEIPSPDGSWITDVVVVSGELPYGVTIGCHENIMYIIGVPAFAGTYEARVDMEIGGGAYQYLIRIIVTDPYAPVSITKHPTGETVIEGENAVFIARADNATQIIWRLVSPDSSTTIECDSAPSYFPGLQVLGLGTETLTLLHIPLSLDGWKVEAKFLGVDGPVFSHGARITVLKAVLNPPVIHTHPVGGSVPSGQSLTLSVIASATEGDMHFQWYRADSDSSDGFAIPGANSPSLVVTEKEGDGYYYVGVWCEDGDRSSEIVLSNIAVLQFQAPPTPTPTPTPSPTPAQPDPQSTPLPGTGKVKSTAAPQPGQLPNPVQPQNGNRSSSNLFLLIGLADAFLLLLISVIIILLRIRSNRK